jgi:tetratricopeptide (TPR) repeat protein
MMYFGGLVQESTGKAKYIPPDYEGMIQNIKTAIKLDPYNMDAYYFAQAILTWDTGRITEANDILEFGMRYRDWDFYLPYFAGFNYAYFLKDYKNAARYYKRAADLTGNDLLIRLTSRYLYESRQTELAIAYLKNMKRTAHNQAVKQSLEIRLRALEEIRRVEIAIEKFTKKTGHRPNSLKELLENGYLESEPVDPYGGHIFLDEMGQVKVSSQLAKVKDNNERD